MSKKAMVLKIFFISGLFSPQLLAVTRLEFVKDCLIPTGSTIETAEISSLSALQWDEKNKTLIALADNQKAFEPQIFNFRFLDQGSMCPVPVSYGFLKNSQNSGLQDPRLKTDGEGLALDTDGTIYVASESATNDQRNSTSEILHIAQNGLKIETLNLPAAYTPKVYLFPQGPEPLKPALPVFTAPTFTDPAAPASVVGTLRWTPKIVEKIIDFLRRQAWKGKVRSLREAHRRRVESLREKHAQEVQKIEFAFRKLHDEWIANHLKKEAGTQFNKGIESLSFDPSSRILTAMAESVLHQDKVQAPDLNRLVRMTLTAQGQIQETKEFYYRTDPKMRVSEIADLGDGTLLVLEIFFDTELRKVFARIYEIKFGQKPGSESAVFLDKMPPVLTKQLVLDLNTIDQKLSAAYPKLDNLEGMAVGPRLPSGQQSLILVSDNNQNTNQITQFLIFKMKR